MDCFATFFNWFLEGNFTGPILGFVISIGDTDGVVGAVDGPSKRGKSKFDSNIGTSLGGWSRDICGCFTDLSFLRADNGLLLAEVGGEEGEGG